MSSSRFLLCLVVTVVASFSNLSRAAHVTDVKGADLDNPVVVVHPAPLHGHIHNSKELLFCERVKVSGRSRLELRKYANALRILLAPASVIPERLHSRIQVCFHRNASLGLCNCENDEWKTVQKGQWNSVMSPFAERYLDVRFAGDIPGSVTISLKEEPQQWRLLCLAIGFVLLFLAPIVSHWVPFYYSTSMAVGVLLVVIILLFQGMKLLPTGRKSVFYLSIYGSLLGAGSFIVHYISEFVNSLLVNLGINEEMHNPVYIFVLVGIILAGAALGYWMVRKFVISIDGSVDVGVAKFVKWAIRIFAATFIFQSTHDTPFALLSLISCCTLCYFINSLLSRFQRRQSYSKNGTLWAQQTGTLKRNRAEFLPRPANMSPAGRTWNRAKSSWPNSPVTGWVSPSSVRSGSVGQDHYSTFHKTTRQRKFTKKEWEDFTKESTRQALAEWASSPDVTNWLIENADRIQLQSSDDNSEVIASESDSTEENLDSSKFNFFNW